MQFFQKIYFFLRNQSEIRLEFQKITLFCIPLLIFNVYLNCMNMMGDKKVSEKSLKKALLNSLPPPHVNSSLQKGLSSRRDVMRRGVSALCATWRSNAI